MERGIWRSMQSIAFTYLTYLDIVIYTYYMYKLYVIHTFYVIMWTNISEYKAFKVQNQKIQP